MLQLCRLADGARNVGWRGRGLPPFVAGQYPYNLIERGLDVELLPAAEAMGVGITIYRPLAGGTLTAKYLSAVPDDSRGKTDER